MYTCYRSDLVAKRSLISKTIFFRPFSNQIWKTTGSPTCPVLSTPEEQVLISTTITSPKNWSNEHEGNLFMETSSYRILVYFLCFWIMNEYFQACFKIFYDFAQCSVDKRHSPQKDNLLIVKDKFLGSDLHWWSEAELSESIWTRNDEAKRWWITQDKIFHILLFVSFEWFSSGFKW